jgi:hypothetical protein
MKTSRATASSRSLEAMARVSVKDFNLYWGARHPNTQG